MMKILLVNPVSLLVEKSSYIKKFLKPLPPLGLAYIASYLEKEGMEVIIIDQYAQGLTNEGLISRIKAEDPDILGFSCLTPTIKNVAYITNRIRLLGLRAKIVLGNIHPSIFAEDILKNGIADIIVRGEGEYTMLELAKAVREGKGLSFVKGISYKEEEAIRCNPDRMPIENLNDMLFPSWNFLDLDKYSSFPLVGLKKGRILTILASRGCIYRCTFCAQEKIHQKPRYRNNVNIVDELEYMHKKYGVGVFAFNDAFFPFTLDQGMDFCDRLTKRGLHKKIKWIIECRTDQVNKELLTSMKKAGLYLIMYGFEVGTQKSLDTLKKNTTLEQSLEAMRLTKKVGIYTLGLFMLGCPKETYEDCKKTISFAKKLDCTIAKFNIVVPYPGTALFDNYKIKFNIEDSEKFMSWLDWSSDGHDMIHVSDMMTTKQLIALQRKAMFKFYCRPKIILRHIVLTPFKDLLYGAFLLIRQQIKIIREKIFL